MTEEEAKIFGSAMCLPEEMAEATDFVAEEAINVDFSKPLPSSFSLGKWIYKTSNQWSLGACTSLWTSHSVQVLAVRKNWIEPTDSNIITIKRKDLWKKMWHDTEKYDGWDYVETAVRTALKEWIICEEDWKTYKFDWYAHWTWDSSEYDKDINEIKHYIYNNNPIVWCIRWDSNMWREMTKWEIVTNPKTTTGWHCIALVGYDESGFWFINSWTPNDWKGLKSRFHVTYDMMKKLSAKFNFRYWVLYNKEDERKSPEYLKRKNAALVILQYLKKAYDGEPQEVKEAIVILSKALRKNYSELNSELPIK